MGKFLTIVSIIMCRNFLNFPKITRKNNSDIQPQNINTPSRIHTDILLPFNMKVKNRFIFFSPFPYFVSFEKRPLLLPLEFHGSNHYNSSCNLLEKS